MKLQARASSAYLAELKKTCERKGWNYAEKAKAHTEKLTAAREKAKAKADGARAKAEAKARFAAEKEKTRLAKLTPAQRKKEENMKKKRSEALDKRWNKERSAGEAYRAKIKAELSAENKY